MGKVESHAHDPGDDCPDDHAQGDRKHLAISFVHRGARLVQQRRDLPWETDVRERYLQCVTDESPIGFLDRVRVKRTPLTEERGFAGAVGAPQGEYGSHSDMTTKLTLHPRQRSNLRDVGQILL